MASQNTIELKSGHKVFYREQNTNKSDKVFLLLHGFPASSFQYRNLMPLLATKYRVVAPDLPGFGFTQVPDGFKYTFDALADVTAEFLDALNISKFSLYIFDYGAPVGLRIATRRPDAVEGIVTQNGNAYVEGFGDVWEPVKKLWASNNSAEERANLKQVMLSHEAIKFQYVNGEPDPSKIAPETYTLDHALIQRPGNDEVQVDLFNDYQNNITQYEQFHEYFRKSQVPLLAVWGKHDVFFIPPGAEAYKTDLPKARIVMLDAGHFAVESHTAEIAKEILQFFQ
ncbi:alpha/beta-hydrolase [Sarocladium strictum]